MEQKYQCYLPLSKYRVIAFKASTFTSLEEEKA